MIGTYTVLAFVLPFLSFWLIGIWTRKWGRLSAFISIIAILGSLFFSILILLSIKNDPGPHYIEWLWLPQVYGNFVFGLWINPLSAIMLFIVALVAGMVQLYSLGYMSEETPPSLGRYYAYHSLFSFSMIGLALAKNILELFVFWELVGLCSYLLIGFWYYKPSAAKAAVKAFWTTKLGDVGFMIGLLIVYKYTGTFDIPEILASAGEWPLSLLTISTLLLFAGAVGKSAQFPLHIWLPDAMEGPTPVSALIHAATMVAAGVYMVARLFPLFEHSIITTSIIALIGSFTAVLAASMAFVQDDIKRVLAYSTISQLGYMMVGLGVLSQAAGFFHLMTHAYFKALLFLCAGAAIHSVHSNSMWDMGGLLKKMPVTGWTFLIGTLALAGFPLLSGYFSKEAILSAAYASEFKLPFYLLLGGVFMTAFYMGRAFFVAFLGKPRTESAKNAHEAPLSMTLPLFILALFSIFGGYVKEGFYEILSAHEIHPEGGGFIPYISLLLLLGAFGLAYLYYGTSRLSAEKTKSRIYPLYTLIFNKYYLDHLAEGAYRYIGVGLSTFAGWWDRHIVDGLVNWVVWTTGRIGRNLRSIQTGVIQDYLFYIVLGLIAIFFLSFQVF